MYRKFDEMWLGTGIQNGLGWSTSSPSQHGELLELLKIEYMDVLAI